MANSDLSEPGSWAPSASATEGARSPTPLTVRPVRFFVIETLLYDEIADLSNDERNELRRQCHEVLQEWRARHADELLREDNRQQDVPLEQLYGTGMAIVVENQRNALRNNIDVALKLCLEGYPPMTAIVSKYGQSAILASVALSDPIKIGRADSLVYLLIVLYLRYAEAFKASRAHAKEIFEQAAREQREQTDQLWEYLDTALSGWGVSATRLRSYVDRVEPAIAARAKSKAALDANRSRGSQVIKDRAAENRRNWRQMAKDVLERRPHWGIDDLIDYILSTPAGTKKEGEKYPRGTVRNALKGIRREWRDEQEKRALVQRRSSMG
jgi:hypothetical protein